MQFSLHLQSPLWINVWGCYQAVFNFSPGKENAMHECRESRARWVFMPGELAGENGVWKAFITYVCTSHAMVASQFTNCYLLSAAAPHLRPWFARKNKHKTSWVSILFLPLSFWASRVVDVITAVSFYYLMHFMFDFYKEFLLRKVGCSSWANWDGAVVCRCLSPGSSNTDEQEE